MPYCITVTVHDHQELDCRTHSYTEHFDYPETIATLSRSQISENVSQCRNEAIETHRATYPRGRNFAMSIVEIQLHPHQHSSELQAAA